MKPIDKLIQRYEDARLELESLLVSSNDPSPRLLRRLDSQLAEAFAALMNATLTSSDDVHARIVFCLDELRRSMEESNHLIEICNCMEEDLLTLTASRNLSERSSKGQGSGPTVSEPKLVELCYVSKAATDLDPSEVEQIKKSAQSFNMMHAITGFLTYDEKTNQFFQILEGPPEGIDLVMSRIVQDPRHFEIEIRYKGPIDARHFSKWSMFAISTSQIQKELGEGEGFDDWLTRLVNHNENAPRTKGRQWMSDTIGSLI